MEYLKILELLPKGWDKDVHYHRFYSTYIRTKLLGFGYKKRKTSKYLKELILNTLLFADDQFIISDTEYNLQKAVYFLYNISKE